MPAEPVFVPMCALCGKPVRLEDCMTDSHGRAVHEDCYLAGLHPVAAKEKN